MNKDKRPKYPVSLSLFIALYSLLFNPPSQHRFNTRLTLHALLLKREKANPIPYT
jgi:hypothetical protein